MYYRNKFAVKLNPDVTAAKTFLVESGNYTSILFAESNGTPTHDTKGLAITDDRWVLCDKTDITDLGCEHLFTLNDVRYFGYL